AVIGRRARLPAAAAVLGVVERIEAAAVAAGLRGARPALRAVRVLEAHRGADVLAAREHAAVAEHAVVVLGQAGDALAARAVAARRGAAALAVARARAHPVAADGRRRLGP